MTEGRNRAQRFLEIYNELDSWLKVEFSPDRYRDHSALLSDLDKSKRLPGKEIMRLRSMAYLRNALVHTTSRDSIAEPTESAIAEYEQLLSKLTRPIMAFEIAVKRSDIYSTSFANKVVEVIQAMNDRTYTHVPILEDDKIIGVFSENTIFSYIASQRDVVHSDTRIVELKDFLPCEQHASEIFPFIERSTSLSDLQALFFNKKEQRKRIGAVFITQNGKPTERVLGMLTAWDVAGEAKG